MNNGFRPLDQETVQSLFDSQEEFLVYYGRMLQTIIAIVHDQQNLESWIIQEPKVDRYVREMDAKIHLSPRQLERINEFLEETRADRGLGQAQVGEHRAATVSSLVTRVLNHAREQWNSCRETAERSRNDPEYLYETTASVLFFNTHFPALPCPNDVYTALREESAVARLALKERDLTPVTPSELRQAMKDPQDKMDFQDFSGEPITDPIRLSITEVAK